MNQAIVEISPEQAYERLQSGALLVDVREDGERAAGMAEGAMGSASRAWKRIQVPGCRT